MKARIPSLCALQQYPVASSFSDRSCVTWCWQDRLSIKKHDHGSWKKFTPFTVSCRISTFRGWRGRQTLTHKGRVHKAWHTAKFRPRNVGNEIQYEILLLCTVRRTELCIAAGAQPKSLGGQLEVIGSETQNVLGGGQEGLEPTGVKGVYSFMYSTKYWLSMPICHAEGYARKQWKLPWLHDSKGRDSLSSLQPFRFQSKFQIPCAWPRLLPLTNIF